MRYTQLDFSPYSSKRKTLFQQAQFLLHELVNGRTHKYPCICGGCIYGAYRKTKKVEGRPFSKRTFFVYFLRSHFFMLTYADKRLLRYDAIKKIGSRLWIEDFSKYADFKEFSNKEPDYLYHDGIKKQDVYEFRLMHITQRRTLDMIKRVLREEQGKKVRTFLNSILRKKSFYTYYNRAGDPNLPSIIENMQKKLTGKLTGLNGKT